MSMEWRVSLWSYCRRRVWTGSRLELDWHIRWSCQLIKNKKFQYTNTKLNVWDNWGTNWFFKCKKSGSGSVCVIGHNLKDVNQDYICIRLQKAFSADILLKQLCWHNSLLCAGIISLIKTAGSIYLMHASVYLQLTHNSAQWGVFDFWSKVQGSRFSLLSYKEKFVMQQGFTSWQNPKRQRWQQHQQ